MTSTDEARWFNVRPESFSVLSLVQTARRLTSYHMWELVPYLQYATFSLSRAGLLDGESLGESLGAGEVDYSLPVLKYVLLYVLYFQLSSDGRTFNSAIHKRQQQQ
jgi:hypothetical protein